MLVLGIVAGIPAVLASGWEWTWPHAIAFAIFVALFLMLAAFPLGFALTAVELLTARLPPGGALLTDAIRGEPASLHGGRGRRTARPRIPLIGAALTGIGVIGLAVVVLLFLVFALADERVLNVGWAVVRGSKAQGDAGWARWTIGAILAGIAVHSLLYAALFEDPFLWVGLGAAVALAALAAPLPAAPAQEPEEVTAAA